MNRSDISKNLWQNPNYIVKIVDSLNAKIELFGGREAKNEKRGIGKEVSTKIVKHSTNHNKYMKYYMRRYRKVRK